MKNKKSMSLSIVILVIGTLILSGFALFTFNLRQKNISEQVQVTRFLEGIYAKESKINFYVENILRGMEVKGLSKEEFESKFVIELNKYKEQGDDWNYEIKDTKVSGEKITFSLKVTITKEGRDTKDKQIAFATHTYNKTFEKIIKKESTTKEESTS